MAKPDSCTARFNVDVSLVKKLVQFSPELLTNAWALHPTKITTLQDSFREPAAACSNSAGKKVPKLRLKVLK